MQIVAGVCFVGIAVFGTIDVTAYDGLTQKIVGSALIVVGVAGAILFFVLAARRSRARK